MYIKYGKTITNLSNIDMISPDGSEYILFQNGSWEFNMMFKNEFIRDRVLNGIISALGKGYTFLDLELENLV